jgi:hypothetical protein
MKTLVDDLNLTRQEQARGMESDSLRHGADGKAIEERLPPRPRPAASWAMECKTSSGWFRRSRRCLGRTKEGRLDQPSGLYIVFKLSTLMVSPSILPVIVTFFPAESLTLSCSLIL